MGRRRTGRRRVAALATFGLLLAIAAIGLASSPISPVAAQTTDAITWTSFDVTLDVRDDGSFHVGERQTIAFRGGPFHVGFAELPLTHIDGIDNGTYAVRTTATGVEVQWGFPSTTNASRTFLLEYDAFDALRSYPNETPPNQQVWWTAVGSGTTDSGDVLATTIQVRLPEVVDPARAVLGLNGDERAADHTTDGQVWTWTAGRLGQGDSFEIRLEVPLVASAGAPAWQEADDTRRAEAERQRERDALYNVMYLGIGLGLLVLGGIGLYGLWYLAGRDPHTGAVASFLAEPPDAMPAGAVGALLDEVVDPRDIVATVAHLGYRGVITIEEILSQQAYGSSRDYALTLRQPGAQLATFEQTLVGALFKPGAPAGTSVKLSEVKYRFDAAAPAIENQIYAELVNRGYFKRSPESTRHRWRRLGLSALGIALVVAIAAGFAGQWRLLFFWFAAAVVFVLSLVLVRLSGSLPRKTAAGAEAAAKWRAFRTYLQDLQRFKTVDESKQIFDRYLAYAVAFGLAESWVRRFEDVELPRPAWFEPGAFGSDDGGGIGTEWDRSTGRRRGGAVVIGSGGPRDDHRGFDLPGIPGLQETSDRAGRSLQSTSSGFFDMLNSAASAFSAFSSSSSSHRSGGHRSSGGFHGGGSRGGAGGGGRRGFR